MKLQRNPQIQWHLIRLIVAAAGVTLMILGAMVFLWQSATKVVHEAIKNQLAMLESQLGHPIEVERVGVGFGSVSLFGVSGGPGGQFIARKIDIDIGLNPLSSGFGKPDTIAMQDLDFRFTKLNRKSSAAGLTPELQLKPFLPNIDLNQLFGAFPVNHRLRIRGARIRVHAGDKLLSLNGLYASVDKRRRSIGFRSQDLSLHSFSSSHPRRSSVSPSRRNAVQIRRLRGSLSAMGNNLFKIKLRQVRPDSRKLAWKIDGRTDANLNEIKLGYRIWRLPSEILAVADVLAPFRKMGAHGSIMIISEPGRQLIDITSQVKASDVLIPRIASTKLGPMVINAAFSGAIDYKKNSIAISSGEVAIPRSRERPEEIKLNLEATIKPVAAQSSPREHRKTPRQSLGSAFDIHIRGHLEPTSCQAILSAVPDGFAPEIKAFRLGGQVAQVFELALRTDQKSDFKFRSLFSDFQCEVKSAPTRFSKEYLERPFSLAVQVGKDDQPQKLDVSPFAPGYASLIHIDRAVQKAFLAAEDISFRQHRGIDLGALEYAVRRNLEAERIAIGGSTITMQTVKNLFLSHERTFSRKAQEIFLAWHLERMLTKDRIIEIYLNIIEFGPSIFGIANASRHYFDKHPSALNLKESAFLASLLPNPRRRYRHFCHASLSGDFRKLVDGLLRRMFSLRQIDFHQYTSALRSQLAFNNTTRNLSEYCANWSAFPLQDKEGQP